MMVDLFAWADERDYAAKVINLEASRCRLLTIHDRLSRAADSILRADRRAAGLELPAPLLSLPPREKPAQCPLEGQREAFAS